VGLVGLEPTTTAL